jgi:DNA adenine methylase
MSIIIPPIKSQGIKTKLIPWIENECKNIKYEKWVEPFLGTGVVAFNMKPSKALLCDVNPHIINFYKKLQDKSIDYKIMRSFLEDEGEKLKQSNGEYYYEVRKRFNDNHSSFDFLFLNRACFNGMMRFNGKGNFNVPFCKKPNRFAPALVTKICNQIKNISIIILQSDFEFKIQDFNDTILSANDDDLIYCDPPYIGRNTNYFDLWNEKKEYCLNNILKCKKSFIMLSTWYQSQYRKNDYIDLLWNDYNIKIREHFYHIGAKESNRKPIEEALLTNF